MNASIAHLVGLAEVIESARERRSQKLLAMPSAKAGVYYKFLYEFAIRFKPKVVVELGTDHGTSAVHLAMGCPQSQVVTVDHFEQPIKNVERLQIPNLKAVKADTLNYARGVSAGSIDLLFVDADHHLRPVLSEYLAYRPLMKDGGIMFFDDIQLHEGMKAFWRSVEDEKVLLPNLHDTGFGAVKVDLKKDPAASRMLFDEIK